MEGKYRRGHYAAKSLLEDMQEPVKPDLVRKSYEQCNEAFAH